MQEAPFSTLCLQAWIRVGAGGSRPLLFTKKSLKLCEILENIEIDGHF
jgi:hypothetical protein